MTFTKDKKIIHNFVNFQTSQKVMFVYPFPASRANKELILYPDNKKINMLGQTLNKIFGSRNDIKDQKNTLKNLCISICSNPFTVR